jgi:hypothetical protein
VQGNAVPTGVEFHFKWIGICGDRGTSGHFYIDPLLFTALESNP